MNTLTKASMLMLLSAPAMAATYQPITQCWEAPTAREDGTAKEMQTKIEVLEAKIA